MSQSPVPWITEAEIKENDAAERELTRLILSRESVAVVGAGYSRDCGFPTWPELIEKLRTRAEEIDPEWEIEATSDSLLDRAESIYRCIKSAHNREAFGDEIVRIFREVEQDADQDASPLLDQERDPMTDSVQAHPRYRLRRFHLDLVRLPFRGFLTTNYDHVLEYALESSGRCPSRPEVVPVPGGNASQISRAVRELAVADSLNHVIHLHGEYESWPTIVLTRSQYLEAYGAVDKKKTRLFQILAGILVTRRLIFIGFSLQDEYIQELLELASVTGWEWGQPIHFAILPRNEETWPEVRERAARLRKEFAIQVVFYEARDGDHTELDALITRIRRADEARGDESAAPPRTLPESHGEGPDWAQRTNEAAAKRLNS